MAASSQDLLGRITTKFPFFTSSDYGYCKCRMAIFLQSINFDVWRMTQIVYTPLTIDSTTWSNEVRNNATLNARAMNALYCVIDENDFNRNSVELIFIYCTIECIHGLGIQSSIVPDFITPS